MSDMKVVICHNCGGFGYTQGPHIALCGHDWTDSAASPGGGAGEDNVVQETRMYECGACSGVGYLTI